MLWKHISRTKFESYIFRPLCTFLWLKQKSTHPPSWPISHDDKHITLTIPPCHHLIVSRQSPINHHFISSQHTSPQSPCLVWHCGRDLPTNDFVVQRILQPHFLTPCVVGNVNHQGTSSEHVPPLVMIGQSVKPNIDSPLDLRGMLYRWEVSSQTHQCCVSCQNYCLSS